MYAPRAFTESDPAALDELLERDPFITLITHGGDGQQVSHLPVIHHREGDSVVFEGHWARPNPQSHCQGEALAIVHGPHAYVSPTAYPDKQSAGRVPTWNYAVAHLRGELNRFDDEPTLADLVARLSRHFEASVGSDWAFDASREDQRRQLRGIVGFRFVASDITLKFKLSQNHPEANIAAVADQLASRSEPRAAAVAAMMRRRLTGHG